MLYCKILLKSVQNRWEKDNRVRDCSVIGAGEQSVVWIIGPGRRVAETTAERNGACGIFFGELFGAVNLVLNF